MEALGMIETRGLVALIEASDAMVNGARRCRGVQSRDGCRGGGGSAYR